VGESRYGGKYLELRGMKWQEGGENCVMRGFIICALNRVSLRYQKKESEVSSACRAQGKNNNCIEQFGW
jgi:hypothetical protein